MTPDHPIILLVDDDPEILASLRDVVRMAFARADVLTARNGPEALRVWRANHLDAIVTDLRMPGMDGLELAEAVHARDPDLPVVLITAFDGATLAPDAKAAGVWDIVRKPFAVEDIVGAIQDCMQPA